MTAPNWRAIICIFGLTMAIPVQSNENTTVNPEHSHCTADRICAGVGYSKDSQRLTVERCYNAIALPTSEQQTSMQLNHAISFKELERELGISVRLSGTHEEFSAAPKAHYTRSLRDNDHSMSLNYYEYAMRTVAVHIKGFGVTALTETGKIFYNKGNHLHFGLTCGDYFISSYQQGVLLLMGINIKFSSATEKEKFNEKAEVIFGSIVSAVESIKNLSAQYKLTGSITVQAFQHGGKPHRLSRMFNNTATGHYYALECSFTEMDNCRKIASHLLNYATVNLPKQYSFQKNVGLMPLGIVFSQHQPIDWIGLIPPVSLVTKEVLQYRKELSSKLKEMEYYEQKLHPFLNNGYPVQLDDTFIHKTKLIASKVNSNLFILMQPHNGSADCFKFPRKCKNIKTRMDTHLKSITAGDLMFLKNIKYIVRVSNSLVFYNTGGELGNSWHFKDDRPNVLSKLVNEIQITDEHCSFSIQHVHIDENVTTTVDFNGTSTGDKMKYIGNLCHQHISHLTSCSAFVLIKKLSLFFFEAYHNIQK